MNNFIDEYRNTGTAEKMAEALKSYRGKRVTLMEVCGTHTMSIFRYGIRDLLPPQIKLISGPGCPVCVTPGFYINSAIDLCKRDDVIIATFGDLMRVPGTDASGRRECLLDEKARGSDIRVVYSPLDSVEIAVQNPDKKIVFLSVGFETTTPVIALSVLKAKEKGLKNFYLLSANKTMPEALRVLITDNELEVNGFLYPGHVSAIIGTGFYKNIAEEYGIPGVVTGFEPLDIMYAIITLAEKIDKNIVTAENQYSRVVAEEGNPLALEKMYEVFEPADAVWRGIGNIPKSGLRMRGKYVAFDAWKLFNELPKEDKEPAGCICGDVLKGKKNPKECKLYGKVCKPESPVGACMVSSEGTCAAYFKYGGET